MKKLISILVAFAMMATLAITSAFAAGIPDDATADQIAVTKNLYVSNDITAFTGNVVISFAPGEATGSAATTAPTETVTKTITLTKDETKATSGDASTRYAYSTGVISPAELGLTTDSKPGVYTFTVTENMTLTTTPSENQTVVNSPAKYTLKVLKTADGKYYFIADDGTDKPEIKSGQTQGDIEANGLQFTNKVVNKYETTGYDNSKFKMEKKVVDNVGIYNDEKFNFDFTIVLPEGTTNADVEASREIASDETYSYDADTNTITGSVKLGKDEQFWFNKIPAGAKVSADENDSLASKDAADKKAYVASDTGVAATTLTSVGQEASITNTSNESQTFEGVLHNSIPYIVLALVAIGGMVAYVVVRRRNADEA